MVCDKAGDKVIGMNYRQLSLFDDVRFSGDSFAVEGSGKCAENLCLS